VREVARVEDTKQKTWQIKIGLAARNLKDKSPHEALAQEDGVIVRC